MNKKDRHIDILLLKPQIVSYKYREFCPYKIPFY